MSKGPWSCNEDVLLKKLVNETPKKQDQIHWVEIGRRMNSRTSKQCRERYRHHLDPKSNYYSNMFIQLVIFMIYLTLNLLNINKNIVNRSALSEEEKDLIWDCLTKGITSHASIAKLIPGRTPLQIKNYIYRERAKERVRIKAKMSLPNICNVSATRKLGT
ncbi:10742_t:CDS:2 [Dentiscutata heterogama]|uniref:10742_t:CDS:1 n=1 Tax=Dentiscutata heterogama TaxID=1316150 RepID=A0ACA9MEN2_9GLOM|nr:10742_t:CDS:2 [Dentiscutata heterogama]